MNKIDLIDLTIFNKLSSDLIDKILSYDNILILRNGKYMNIIPKHDKRYKLLERLPRPIKIYSSSYNYIYSIRLFNFNDYIPYGYILTYNIINKNIFYLSIKFSYRVFEKFIKYNKTKTKDVYIIDYDSQWKKIKK
jgi:hypothetical protein